MSHEVLDQRSLELHRAIVDRLRENPQLFEVPRRNLERWLSRPNLSRSLERIYKGWLEILDIKTPQEIFSLLLADDEESRLLRQNTPFTGILTPREVQEIKNRFAHVPR